jgi:hypothetical protein
MTARTFEVATQEDFEGLRSDKRTYLAKPTEFTPLEVYLNLKGLASCFSGLKNSTMHLWQIPMTHFL